MKTHTDRLNELERAAAMAINPDILDPEKTSSSKWSLFDQYIRAMVEKTGFTYEIWLESVVKAKNL